MQRSSSLCFRYQRFSSSPTVFLQSTKSLRTRAVSCWYNSSSSNEESYSYINWNLGMVLAGVCGGFLSFQSFSAAEEEKPSYKEQIFGEYENRIRETSAPEKIFEYFASVQKGRGVTREYFMTPADFIRAITPYTYKQGADVGVKGSKFNENPEVSAPFAKILQLIDQDGDGLISFSEFIFFSTLLAIPPKYFRVAFNLFDEDGNGTVSAEEFKSVMYLLHQSNPLAKAQRSSELATDSAGTSPLFFGEDGGKELDFDTFSGFLNQLRDAVLQMQFNMIASEDGTVSARDYAMSLASYGNLRHMSDYLVRVEKLKDYPKRITFEEYRAFNRVLESLSEIHFALNSFASMGKPFTKGELKRAASAVDVDLTDNLLDVIFFLFDKDGDGKLDNHEFVGVLEGRQTFGFSKPRDSGFLRFTTCIKECMTKETYRK